MVARAGRPPQVGHPDLAILPVAPADAAEAGRLARELGLPVLPPGADPVDIERPLAALVVDGGRLRLQQTGPGAPGPVTVAFGGPAMRHRRRGGQNELLGRAVGVGRKALLTVLDATAGLGRDSFILADLGCRVRLCEREPVLVAMLSSALVRAAAGDDPWLAEVASRMELKPGDARQLAATALGDVDVIYLDPMFPPRDKSAAVKKEMALLQQLLSAPCPQDDADQLLTWALGQSVARVVVKRSCRAPCLGRGRPSHQLRGRTVRYDIYTLGPWR